MMTKKITKIIVYFDDGTFEEVMKAHTPSINPAISPQTPYWTPPFTVTCSASEAKLGTFQDWSSPYNISTMTNDGAPITNKYAITSSGNGNVEIQR